ncbi:hypothetical protein THOM_1531 [Trachipleistophora hominis]|uniref:Uncharacterized protein n=1 Tax=Trachipleistophora hominis TaxID=72359 RepID=L7JXK8_TRAHO|nr:hypothetical protein THOM_1531 [Trachipleistophora hominis]
MTNHNPRSANKIFFRHTNLLRQSSPSKPSNPSFMSVLSTHINKFLTTLSNNFIQELHKTGTITPRYSALIQNIDAFERTLNQYFHIPRVIHDAVQYLRPKYEVNLNIPQHYGSYAVHVDRRNIIRGLPAVQFKPSIFYTLYKLYGWLTANWENDKKIDRMEQFVIPKYFENKGVCDLRNYESGDVVNGRVEMRFEVQRDGKHYYGRCLADLRNDEIRDYEENEIA